MKKTIMSLLRWIIGKPSLNDWKKRGLIAADDLRCISIPNFGSEPYLINIGKHVTISSNVTFINHDGGTWVFRNRPEFKHVIKYGRITINDNCFIGFGSILLPGITIGPDSVIAAGSVISKTIPPGEVWGGVPARRICSIDEYAQKTLEASPDYDVKAYRKDKKKELLRII